MERQSRQKEKKQILIAHYQTLPSLWRFKPLHPFLSEQNILKTNIVNPGEKQFVVRNTCSSSGHAVLAKFLPTSSGLKGLLELMPISQKTFSICT